MPTPPSRRLCGSIAVAATSASLLTIVPAANAATSDDLASSLFVTPSVVTGSSLLAPSGAAGASTLVATAPVAGFPRDGSSYAVLSTGRAADFTQPNSAGNRTAQFGGATRAAGNDKDVTVLTVDVDVPAGANCLTGVDFRFFSEEFPEYVGDAFNDAFIAEVDSTTWTATASGIDAPSNFAFDSAGNVVSINAAGAASMTAGDAAGTTYDGGTGILTARTPITPGAHQLFFSIFDQGDDRYDSTVLVDNVRFGTVANVDTQCKPGVQTAPADPEPTPEPEPEPTVVSAGPIAHVDPFGTADDTYTIPATEGVDYYVDDVLTAPGTYPGSGTVTVTAVAQDGYTLTGTSSFEVVFTAARAQDLTSTGIGRAEQSVEVPVPAQGTVTLLRDGAPATSIETEQGEYRLDPETGRISFLPRWGFSGEADGVTYRITERDDHTSTATYVPTVVKPGGPVASPATSQGTVGQTQSVDVPGDVVSLIDGEGAEVSTLVVPGVGTYRVLGDGMWSLAFTPEACVAGAISPVTYRVADLYGQHDDAPYTPAVTVPEAPAPALLSSEGTGTEPQHDTVPVPDCGSVTLLDDEGAAATTVTRDGEGTFTLDAETGRVTFVPVFGYSGRPAPLDLVVDDGYGHQVPGRYKTLVHAPAAAAPTALETDGVGTTPQSTVVDVPEGGSFSLLDEEGVPTFELVVPGEGTYLVDPETRTITFLPTDGFSGTTTPVTYEVTDAYGQRSTSTVTATVEVPPAPVTEPVRSTGPAGDSQEVSVVVPAGGSLALVGPEGKPVTRIRVARQGVYRVDPVLGRITFTPVAGFEGRAAAITYVVTDAYGQSSTATYRARVASSPEPGLRAERRVRSASAVRTVCTLTVSAVRGCVVRAYAVVAGDRVQVGRGSSVAPGTRHRAGVVVRLNRLGKALAARPGGTRLTLNAVVRGTGTGVFETSGRSAVVAPTVRLRPVHFDTDSARLRPEDRTYLLQVRSQLGAVRVIDCTGFADARSTVGYNAALGRSRAQAVCDVLAQGVRATVRISSHGEHRPVGDNGTDSGRALNRRAEVVLHY